MYFAQAGRETSVLFWVRECQLGWWFDACNVARKKRYLAERCTRTPAMLVLSSKKLVGDYRRRRKIKKDMTYHSSALASRITSVLAT